MRNFDEEQAAIEAAIKEFPEEFGLSGFPGERFRLGHRMSHFVSNGEVQLVVQIWHNAEKAAMWRIQEWSDFGRNTPEFIKQQMVNLI